MAALGDADGADGPGGEELAVPSPAVAAANEETVRAIAQTFRQTFTDNEPRDSETSTQAEERIRAIGTDLAARGAPEGVISTATFKEMFRRDLTKQYLAQLRANPGLEKAAWASKQLDKAVYLDQAESEGAEAVMLALVDLAKATPEFALAALPVIRDHYKGEPAKREGQGPETHQIGTPTNPTVSQSGADVTPPRAGARTPVPTEGTPPQNLGTYSGQKLLEAEQLISGFKETLDRSLVASFDRLGETLAEDRALRTPQTARAEGSSPWRGNPGEPRAWGA